MNWNNVECIPPPQVVVGLGIRGKFASRRANILALSSEEIVQRRGSKMLILQLDDNEEANVVEEILFAPKQKPRRPRKSAAEVVKVEDDEDAPSKNWEDSEVHTLIVICDEMEANFLKNAKKTR
jgi:hypothetical protein